MADLILVWYHGCMPEVLTLTGIQSWSSYRSLSFNRKCTSPPLVWRPCRSVGWRSRPAPRHATVGPSPCSDPPGRSPGPHRRATRTTLSGRSGTGTGLIREAESSWCSWRVWAGSSWRAARDLVSASSPPAGQHPEPEPPSLCRCLNECKCVQFNYEEKWYEKAH